MNNGHRATRVASIFASILASTLALALPASPGANAIDPRDYPTLDEVQLGHLRHLVKMAHQLPGDWSGYGSQWLLTERTQQFQIAFSAMTLALAQHQYTPAYRELYRDAIAADIEKLQHPDIWERWMFSSRSGARGGILKDMQPGWMDPIAKDNIMLKAYLLQLGAAYEMLYDDRRYDQPDAFTFFYRGQGMGNGLIKFRYSLGDIAKNIQQEVVDSDYVGSACEPARIFWACQAPSSVGFIHYDQMHGTNYAAVLPKMKRSWLAKGYIDPKAYTYAEVVQTSWDNRAKDQRPVPLTPMVRDIGGWSGTFNHAWDKAFVEAAYYGPKRAARDEALEYYTTGAYAQAPNNFDDPIHAYASVAWGLYLAYAAEVGDKDAVGKMLAYARRNYKAVWDNGEYYYPRSDDYSVDAAGNSHGIDPWTGNVFIPMARLNQGSGFCKLYNEPWGEAQYRAPFISDIDTISVNVSQAYYDKTKDALIVTVQPGPIAAKHTEFTIRQLDPAKIYDVTQNNVRVGQVAQHASTPGIGVGSMTWHGDGSLSVSVDATSPQTFIFAAHHE